MDNYFIVEINFSNSRKTKTGTFKIECGNKFEGFLFYTVNGIEGIGEYHNDLFNPNKFVFEYRIEKDFNKIFEYLKKIGEIL